MKKKAPKQKAKKRKSPMARWQEKVKKEVPPGRPIPDELAAQAPA